MKSKRCIFGH